jgi:hypothetical protein
MRRILLWTLCLAMLAPATAVSQSADPPPDGVVYRTVYPDYAGDPDFDELLIGNRPRFFGRSSWFDLDVLIWSLRPMQAPPLVTRNDSGGIGALGEPGTRVLLGGSDMYPGTVGGIRGRLGTWIGDEERFGLEIGGFALDEAWRRRFYGSDAFGYPQYSRPIYWTDSGEGSFLVSSPNFLAGGLEVETSTRFGGVEANAVWLGYSNERVHAEFLGGFRFLSLEEDLTILQRMRTLAPTAAFGTVLPTNTSVSLFDAFGTTNRFYGGQIGTRIDWVFRRFSVGLLGKLAIGGTEQQLAIDGSSRVQLPGGGPSFYRGGLLATSSNIGQYSGSSFSLVPELGVNLGIELTPRMRLKIGYSLLYWTNVVRPGSQIDRAVNPATVPASNSYGATSGPQRPYPSFSRTDFWAEGLNLGLEFRF